MEWVAVFSQLAPFIFTCIQGIEALLGKGNGAVKKAAVTSMANAALTGLQTVSTGGQKATVDTLAPAISTFIDASVALANSAGAFGQTAADVPRSM